jgi:hypothetical protein
MYKKIELFNSLGILFKIFGNIGNVPLSFSTLKLEHRHLNKAQLSKEFSSFYFNQCKSQMINILASSDIIGNPNELITHFQSGLLDLLTFSGELSFSGFFRGLNSFFNHSVFGASNSMYKLFDSFKNGMNSMYLTEQKDKSLVSNLFMSTLKLGLLFPNLAASFASSTANSIRDAVQEPTRLRRKRPPRPFQTSSILTVYSFADSVGQYVLSVVEQGKYFNEGIKSHSTVGELVVVVTSRRVLCAVVEESRCTWHVLINRITCIRVDEQRLVIYFVTDELGFRQEKVELKGDVEELRKLESSVNSLRME